MTQSDYTKNILNIEDPNITFYENSLNNEVIKGVTTKVFRAYLTYTPSFCPICGCVNESRDDIIKWNFKRDCTFKLPKVSNFNTVLLLNLMNKISEKDIASRHNVSHNKVNRIMNDLSRKTVLPGTLPSIMNFDEFKATKDTEGKMAFIITNTKNGKTFDILPSRKSHYLKRYFLRFQRKEQLKVKFIIIDLFTLIMIYLNNYFLMLLLFLTVFILLL